MSEPQDWAGIYPRDRIDRVKATLDLMRMLTEACAERDRARDVAVALERQLTELQAPLASEFRAWLEAQP